MVSELARLCSRDVDRSYGRPVTQQRDAENAAKAAHSGHVSKTRQSGPFDFSVGDQDDLALAQLCTPGKPGQRSRIVGWHVRISFWVGRGERRQLGRVV